MIDEIDAAVKHCASLIQTAPSSDEPTKLVAQEPVDTFTATLKTLLHARCQDRWFADEAERGSATRAIVWQTHSAGEGPDVAILGACKAVVASRAEPRKTASSQSSDALELAVQWFPHPFTMWIDPDCVAIRMGPGPGVGRSQFDLDARPCSTAIHVVWGKLVAQPSENHNPAVTITSSLAAAATMPERRPIPIVRPESKYPSSMVTSRPRHARTLSSSSCGSSSGGLTRSASMTSNGSHSTTATSYFSGEESDSCPSLVSPSASSTSGKSSSDDEGVDGDETVSMPPFQGVNLLFGEDGENAGDCTIQADDAGDCTLMLEEGAPIRSTPHRRLTVSKDADLDQREQAYRSRTESVSSSVNDEGQVKCNYTIHDNGNVGVLGGGVRLGGARPAGGNNGGSGLNALPHHLGPRNHQHASSKSVSNVYAPHPFSLREIKKQDPYFSGTANYSAPSHPMPLPPLPNQLYGPHSYSHPPQHPYHPSIPSGLMAGPNPAPIYMGSHGFSGPTGPAMRGPYYGAGSGGYEPSMPAVGGFGDGIGFRTRHGAAPSVSFAPCPTQGYDHGVGYEEGSVAGSVHGEHGGRRRVRSRGRRSRGRGAGRAARRQAAALKALQEAGADFDQVAGGALGLDLDGEISEASSSRCSTPAGHRTGPEGDEESDYASSSCYSSAASSPAKAGYNHRFATPHRGHHDNIHNGTGKLFNLEIELAALRLDVGSAKNWSVTHEVAIPSARLETAVGF